MSEHLSVDICVIGAGSGGLSVAAGASQLGASVVLLEKHKMGGDCLNYGCVPSKALLAAGHAADAVRAAPAFGIETDGMTVDFGRVHAHVHAVIDSIAPVDSVERFEALGVRVIREAGRFVGPREVRAGETHILARRFVVATGSTAFVPPIAGLEATPFFTNETIFDNKTCPEHLIIIGGGPIGVEMAQAHRRLGAAVTIVARSTVLPKDDPELTRVVVNRLRREGVIVTEGAKVSSVGGGAGEISVAIETDEGEQRIDGSHLLVAAGRRPSIDGLGLEQAGIAYSPTGIQVDARLRTTNRRVYAMGDVTGGLQFTHVAGYHAGIVIRNALFRLPAKADHGAIPWVTYTDPELAHVGPSETDARRRFGDIRVLRAAFAENDRAQTERRTEGMIKVITDKRGRVRAASIVGPHAGELIQPWVLAISNGMKIGKLAAMVAPYPTLTEISKRAAGSYFVPTLFSERTRRIVRFLARFG